MPYVIVGFTTREVAAGAGHMPVRLGEALLDRMIDFAQNGRRAINQCEAKIYFLNSFINREVFAQFRQQYKDDAFIFYLLNDCAVHAAETFGVAIVRLGEVRDDELPEHVGTSLVHTFVQ